MDCPSSRSPSSAASSAACSWCCCAAFARVPASSSSSSWSFGPPGLRGGGGGFELVGLSCPAVGSQEPRECPHGLRVTCSDLSDHAGREAQLVPLFARAPLFAPVATRALGSGWPLRSLQV